MQQSINAGGRAKGAAPKKTWKGDKAAARGTKPSGKPAAGGKRKPFKGGMQKDGKSGRKTGGKMGGKKR